MTTIFYIVLVLMAPEIEWSWGWFIISVIFSAIEGKEIINHYIYTDDPEMDGVTEDD